MQIIRPNIIPPLSPEVVDVLYKLQRAVTVRQVLALSDPIPVAPLADPELFSAFFNPNRFSSIRFSVTSEGAPTEIRTSKFTSAQKGKGSLTETYDDIDQQQFRALSEATSIINAYQPIIGTDKGGSFKTKTLIYQGYMSERVSHGITRHMEIRESQFSGVGFSVTNKNGTEITPSHLVISAFKNSRYSQVLDRPFHTQTQAIRNFDKELREGTITFDSHPKILPENWVYFMIGATVHQQP